MKTVLCLNIAGMGGRKFCLSMHRKNEERKRAARQYATQPMLVISITTTSVATPIIDCDVTKIIICQWSH